MKKKLLFGILCIVATLTLQAQHRSITWEKFNNANPELKQVGALATKPSGELNSPMWSVGCETLDRDYAKFDNYKKYVSESGINSARLQSGWAKCEPKKGKYEFAWLDSCVYGLHEIKVKPWICLCYGNPLYGADKGLGAKIFTDDETMNAWLKYVETTVKRYKNVVTEWEIWNEPNLGQNREYADSYANLLMKTTGVIKKVQPDAVIIGISLAGIASKFTEQVFEILKANNKADIMDYLTYHPYVHNPDAAIQDIESLQKLAQSYDPSIKLFQGETGCPSILEWGHALNYYEWTEYSQVKWNLRQMINHWSMGIRYNVFTLVDLQYPNMLQSFGLLRLNLLKEFVYKRPSYYGVQHTINVLDDSVSQAGRLSYKANTFREIAVHGIKKDKIFGVMLWFSDRIPSDDLSRDKVDITIDNLKFGDPVYVDMITGKIYEIPVYNRKVVGDGTKFTDLPLWDSPVMIAERSHIKMKNQ
jgi:hypothetical protein